MTTPKRHFDEDITRALALHAYAKKTETSGDSSELPHDIRGSAVAMTVGAMDAYFCDKYVDCLTAALSAYADGEWKGQFPSSYRKQALPAGEVLDASRTQRPKWGIRMAARSIMERDFMYSLSRIDEAFNGILPPGRKLWLDIVDQFAALQRKRFTKFIDTDLASLSGEDLTDAKRQVAFQIKKRIGLTVQFRHDWIHNCSRPKGVIIRYTDGEAKAAINEIVSLVDIFESHIERYRLA